MKRVLWGVSIICLILLGGLLGWGLYRATEAAAKGSERLTEISGEYGELTERFEELSLEHSNLSRQYSELSQQALGLLRKQLEVRGHGNGTTVNEIFTESDRELDNPNRGFYHMHGFHLSDTVNTYEKNVAGRFAEDQGPGLTLIEVNLQGFREGEISGAGLESLDNLLKALSNVDKQLILRFLYDWNGENLKYEPDSLDVILGHMEQVSALLKKYDDRIFLIQGLFVGNYGEMNNSRYLDTGSTQTLAGKLLEAAGGNAYLAVRTPAHWRGITGLSDPMQAVEGGGLAARMGLYNDGMLGSATDCGTYGMTAQAGQEAAAQWGRAEELAFQDALCRYVPIGGEVIIDNEYNDLENALEDMRTMHVTYLNRDYDLKVLDKWAGTAVREEGCFDGMDGLSYVERHLGYRLVLREAALDYSWETDGLTAGITLQNVGFAPVYRETETKIILYDRARGREYACHLETGQDIRELAGGTDSERLMTLNWELPLSGLLPGEMEVYFSVTDVLSGEMLLLGNEQEPDRLGYRVGTLTLGDTEELWEQLRQEVFGGAGIS